MPRGRVRFDATSPKHPDWPRNPEQAVREILAERGAEYIERSLAFSHNLRKASAMFETSEPSGGDCGTDYYGLAYDLDASDVTLYISAEVWLQRMEPEGESAA